MKNLVLIFSIAFCSALIQAQEIDCSNICVENIAYNDTSGFLEVTVYNGSDDFINYPIVMVEVDGEIVANWDSTFVFFGQMAESIIEHELETSLTSVPVDFTCTVYIIDGLWDVICTLSYPCIPDVVVEIPEIQLVLYPNPSSDILHVTCGEALQSVEVYNADGKCILVQRSNSDQINLNIEKLATGAYCILCKSEYHEMKQFFIKE